MKSWMPSCTRKLRLPSVSGPAPPPTSPSYFWEAAGPATSAPSENAAITAPAIRMIGMTFDRERHTACAAITSRARIVPMRTPRDPAAITVSASITPGITKRIRHGVFIASSR
jgi:hypothetical protein